MHDIFISYSRADADVAEQIAERLHREGLSFFLDAQGVLAGENWSDVLERRLESADTIIALLSTHTSKSKWVQEEIQQALAREKRVIPILLDDHAKENWLWPLLATRDSFRLDPASSEFHLQIDKLARDLGKSDKTASLNSEGLPPPMMHLASAARQTNHIWGVIFASAAIGSVVTWLVQWLISK